MSDTDLPIRTFSLWIGDKTVRDILDPKPEEIDLDAIDAHLWGTQRFSGAPDSLTVRQHTWLVNRLAAIHDQPPHILEWCWHHDDHEAYIGDIPGPLKTLIGQSTDLLNVIERRLDVAICEARGIPVPPSQTRQIVHFYDKLAETLEWQFVLRRGIAHWNMQLPPWLPITVAESLALDAEFRTPGPNGGWK